MDCCDPFTRILHGCFTDIEVIAWLPSSGGMTRDAWLMIVSSPQRIVTYIHDLWEELFNVLKQIKSLQPKFKQDWRWTLRNPRPP